MAVIAKLKLVTVTTAGTAVPVFGSSDARSNIVSVTIQAATNNIFVGDSTVKASTNNGIQLVASTHDKLQLLQDDRNIVDLGSVYLDTGTSGSVASVLYWVRV